LCAKSQQGGDEASPHREGHGQGRYEAVPIAHIVRSYDDGKARWGAFLVQIFFLGPIIMTI
jgi:hypothetical protein